MAVDTRHAAWQNQTTFAVRLLADSGAETELAPELPDLPAATDFAFEWLNREDPGREGSVRLVIVRVDGSGGETVWMYPPATRSAGQELISVFGFNPATWQPQSPARPPRPEPRRSLPARRPDAAVEARPRAAAPTPTPAPARVAPPSIPAPQPTAAAGRTGSVAWRPGTSDWVTLRRRVAKAFHASWDDLPSRSLLLVAVCSLWFALALLEPAILVVTAAALGALRVRQSRLAEIDRDEDF